MFFFFHRINYFMSVIFFFFNFVAKYNFPYKYHEKYTWFFIRTQGGTSGFVIQSDFLGCLMTRADPKDYFAFKNVTLKAHISAQLQTNPITRWKRVSRASPVSNFIKVFQFLCACKIRLKRCNSMVFNLKWWCCF